MIPSFPIDPATLTPAERVRGTVALIRENIAAAKAAAGLIGKIDAQVLVGIPTDRGMGVVVAMPLDAFLADLDAITAIPAPADVPTDETPCK